MAVPESPAEGQTMADIYDDHIRLAVQIEELGWHSYYTIEHQNRPGANITAPTVYLTAIARATSKLRLGAMMWQLPFYHPLRLAQEVAMLDHLSRGRVEFGTGIGVHEHEFIRWGVDYYQRAAIAGEVARAGGFATAAAVASACASTAKGRLTRIETARMPAWLVRMGPPRAPPYTGHGVSLDLLISRAERSVLTCWLYGRVSPGA